MRDGVDRSRARHHHVGVASRPKNFEDPDETIEFPLLTAKLVVEDRGTHALKGLAAEWRLYAYVADGEPDV
jgi:hypothetical protein